MASTQARIGQQALAVLDVALRVPCIFIIDAIFNSYYDPGSGWASAVGKVLVRVLGVLISSMVLLLSQKALFKFYTLFFAVLLGVAAILFNYYATSHIDFYSAYYKAALGFRLLPRNGPTLWLGMAAVQLLFGVGYVFLLNLQSVFAALVVLDIMIPLWGLMIELPADVRQLVAVFSGLALALNTAVCLAMRLKWFYYSCRYVYLLVRHMYRIYGLQLLLEDTWKRIRFPDVLRVFWLTRITAQALILIYVVRAVRRESGDATGGAADGSSNSQGYLLSWDVFWDLTSNLIISGCDSTLTVLGMSAVISSVAHYLGLSILAFIGISVSISTFSLVAIAIERYSAICNPLKSRSWQTRSHAYRVIAATWVVSLLIMVPYPVFSVIRTFPKGNSTVGHMCRLDWPSRQAEQTWYVLLLFTLFFIPGVVMIIAYGLISRELYRGIQFELNQSKETTGQKNGVGRAPAGANDDDDGCYVEVSKKPSSAVELPTLSSNAAQAKTECSRSNTSEAKLQAKRRVVRMLMVIVALFFICWMPLYSANTWKAFDLKSASRALSGAPISFIHLLSYTSACVNPVIYCFMNTRFRKALLATFACCCRNRLCRQCFWCRRREAGEDGMTATSMATSMGNSKFSYTTVSTTGT